MFCPVCKGEFREGFTHCDECNVDLVASLDNISTKIEGEFMLCPHCNKEFHNGETICSECGLKIDRDFNAALNLERYVG